MVVGGSPRIGFKIQATIIFLYILYYDPTLMLNFVLTCNILAIRARVRAKTSRTSRNTVEADGIKYSGWPVFMRHWNPQSLTILNGQLLSATQCTISALLSMLLGANKILRVDILGFGFCVTAMRVCDLPFSFPCKTGRN